MLRRGVRRFLLRLCFGLLPRWRNRRLRPLFRFHVWRRRLLNDLDRNFLRRRRRFITQGIDPSQHESERDVQRDRDCERNKYAWISARRLDAQAPVRRCNYVRTC